MSKIKQVIVIRKDLNMRKGKMCAMAAHASMKVFFDRMFTTLPLYQSHFPSYSCEFTKEMIEWMEGSFAKICVSVNSEEELLALKLKAEEAKLPVALITDNGLTEFHGIPTNTCIAIGPANSEDIDPITGSLPLL